MAAFDRDEHRRYYDLGKTNSIRGKLADLCCRMQIHIGIIVVPAEEAQKVCDILVSSGVLAIWNFAPVHLSVPENVLVRNEDIAGSLAVLAKRLAERL